MNIGTWQIFRFVEIIFLIGIIINIISYLVRLFIILYNKQSKVFFQTAKEGFSKKILIRNGLNFSLLLTSISVFWYMLHISKNFNSLTMQAAYKANPFVTLYILTACLILLIYSIYISILNIKKIKELTPVLGVLSFWNSADTLFNTLGGGIIFKPFTDVSLFLRKHLIQSQLESVVISTFILVISEYVSLLSQEK